MVNSNTSALGIIFPNSYDALVPDLVSVRLMASIPFASRYRLIDFILSSMSNCDIDNISCTGWCEDRAIPYQGERTARPGGAVLDESNPV